MSYFDPRKRAFTGVGVDILCLIAQQLNLDLEQVSSSAQDSVTEKLQQIQNGQADIFVGVSDSKERSKRGLFTDAILFSHYAVIGRRGARVNVRNPADLGAYRIGYISGASIEQVLNEYVPADQLQAFSLWDENGIFQALRNKEIDLALFTQHVFQELRYQRELFDLEVVYTLYDHPRAYRFYISQSPEHEALVQAINAYLAVIDSHASIMAHQDSEREFLNRYVEQRSQRIYLLVATLATTALALIAYLALRRHRRFTQLLQERNRYIEQQHLALHEVNQKLEAQNRTDALTGVFNRRYFDESLAQAYQDYLQRRKPLSLLLIDIDHFKTINDTYGHSTGDKYLRTIGQALKDLIPHTPDTPHFIARYGGEEFSCLLINTGPEEARVLAERLRLAIEQLQLPNATIAAPWVTTSVGVATMVDGDPGVPVLFAQADIQLYRAKRSGRNQVCTITINLKQTDCPSSGNPGSGNLGTNDPQEALV